MAFDPTKPANHSQILSAELRNQFNALQGQITALQQQVALLFPVLTFDSTSGLWNVTYSEPTPVNWEIWKRCNYATTWGAQGTLQPSHFPAPNDSVLGLDEVWWQVKFVGLNGDDQPMTPFSNVVSGGPVPDLAPALTANNVTMSLDWTYNGPPCDVFHIFVHHPDQAPGVFDDQVQVRGDLRTWATDFDDPADALGHKYYIVPMDGDANPLTPPSITVNFAAG